MKKNLLFLLLSLPLFLNSKTLDVAGWRILGFGEKLDQIQAIDDTSIATIFVEGDEIILSFWDPVKEELIYPNMILENLYIDLEKSKKNDCTFIEANIKILDSDKTGTLAILLSKQDSGIDIIEMHFPGEDIFFAGRLIEEEDMYKRLFKLAVLETFSKDASAKLSRSLDEILLDVD